MALREGSAGSRRASKLVVHVHVVVAVNDHVHVHVYVISTAPL
jgi:hypothetical protein